MRRRVMPLSLAAVVVLVVWAGPALATFRVLAPGYHQRDRVAVDGSRPYVISGPHVIRDDGTILVAARTQEPVDGLHAVMPWSTELTANTLLSDEYVVALGRDNDVYVAALAKERADGGFPIVRLDPDTGEPIALIREHMFAPRNVTFDPLSHGLLLLDCPAEFECRSVDDSTGTPSSSDRISALDLATGARTDLVVGIQDIAGVSAVAISNDGQQIFVARSDQGIDVYDRGGGAAFAIPTGAFVSEARIGPPGTCFEDDLIYWLFDGSAWVVRDPSLLNTTSEPLFGGNGGNLTSPTLTFDPDGHLVAASDYGPGLPASVTLIDCEELPSPPTQPEDPGEPAADPSTATPGPSADDGAAPPSARGPLAGPPAGPPAGPAAPGGTAPANAPQPLAQTGTAPQPGSAPSAQSAASIQFVGSSQASLAPQAVPVAEDAADRPQLSFSASRRRPTTSPAWISVVLAMTAAAAFPALRHSPQAPLKAAPEALTDLRR